MRAIDRHKVGFASKLTARRVPTIWLCGGAQPPQPQAAPQFTPQVIQSRERDDGATSH